MDISQIKTGRHLLYLDILGFKDMVRDKKAQDVYKILDSVLSEFNLRGKRIGGAFKTLYFSDTIIFYQSSVGWEKWAFLDSYAVAAMVWTALAANGIPSRGAISFGEFHVETSSSGEHNVFWGSALIDAYETESDRDHQDWIGITICESARNAMDYMENGCIDLFTSEGRFIRQQDGSLLLNPFLFLGSVMVDEVLDNIEDPLEQNCNPDILNEVRALAFIKESADRTIVHEEYSEKISRKYKYTYERIAKMLGRNVVRWALGVATRSRQT
jgi:hypothetical protein